MNTRFIIALPLATTIACGTAPGTDVEVDLAPLSATAPETQALVLSAIEQNLGRPAGGVDLTEITVEQGSVGVEETNSSGPELTAGEYTAEVTSVYYATSAREGRSVGDITGMTITESATGLMIDGFIDVQSSDGNFNGFGLLVESDPTYDCSTEWSRGVSGYTDGDGTTMMDVSEMIVVTGKECGMTTMGDTGIEEFHMQMVLAHAS